MTTLLEKFNKEQEKKLPDLKPGDTIKVHQKIKEGGAEGRPERIQIFQGVVVAKKHGKGISGTITVRKVVDRVGVERVFPIHSPSIDKIEVVKHGKVRRAKLYYLRTAKGKKSKLKGSALAEAIAPEEIVETPAEVPVETAKTDLPAQAGEAPK